MAVLVTKATNVTASVQGELGSILPGGFLAIVLQILQSLLSGGLGGGCLTPTPTPAPTPVPASSLTPYLNQWTPRVRFAFRQAIRDQGLNDFEQPLMRGFQAQAVVTTADELTTASTEIVSWMA